MFVDLSLNCVYAGTLYFIVAGSSNVYALDTRNQMHVSMLQTSLTHTYRFIAANPFDQIFLMDDTVNMGIWRINTSKPSDALYLASYSNNISPDPPSTVAGITDMIALATAPNMLMFSPTPLFSYSAIIVANLTWTGKSVVKALNFLYPPAMCPSANSQTCTSRLTYNTQSNSVSCAQWTTFTNYNFNTQVWVRFWYAIHSHSLFVF